MNEIMRRALAEAMRPIVELVRKLENKLTTYPRFEWGVVTQINPLRVKLESHAIALPDKPDSIIAGLEIGDRVRVERQGTRVTVHGAGGGDTTKQASYEPGFKGGSAAGSGNIRCVVRSGWVFVAGGASPNSGSFAAGTEFIVARLPSNVPPPAEHTSGGAQGASGRGGVMTVLADGRILFQVHAGQTASAWLRGSVAYPARG